jgi:hypothetical protein
LPVLASGSSTISCPACGSTYRKGSYWFDFTPPPATRDDSPLWKAWQHLQANGLVGYTVEPDRNLSVGDRDDCKAFARFCKCRGLVLDIGCGPQRWPAYFVGSGEASYVGLDPWPIKTRLTF